MVREKFIKTINETIEQNPNFSISDFKIDQKKTNIRGIQIIVEIKYIYCEEFQMKINIPDSRSKFKDKYQEEEEDYNILCENCPGELKLIEQTNVKGINGVIKHLSEWLILIWEELMSIPTNREIQSLKDSVNELFGKIQDFDGQDFSVTEKTEFRNKLDDLERKFQENLKSQEIEKNDLETKLQFLHKEIEALKKTLDVFNKDKWYKSLASKVITWGSKSENQKMISNGMNLFNNILSDKN